MIALVLAETAAGTAAVVWLTGLWGGVKRGFFILTTMVVVGCAVLAALAASGADAVSALAWTTTGVAGASLLALLVRRLAIARWLGLATLPVGGAMLVAMALVAEAAAVPATLQLLAGAGFMGAVTVGLLLGHWYLVDRGLARDHIMRLAVVLIGAVIVEAVAVVIGAATGTIEATAGFSLFLTAGGTGFWLTIVLGMVALTALIAFLIRAALREPRPRAVQAATGFFYLAVITAFTAELAAKVRFLG